MHEFQAVLYAIFIMIKNISHTWCIFEVLKNLFADILGVNLLHFCCVVVVVVVYIDNKRVFVPVVY